jgi:hypothetical protein
MEKVMLDQVVECVEVDMCESAVPELAVQW